MTNTSLQQVILKESVVSYALSLTGAPFRPHVKLHTSRLKQMRLTGGSYLGHEHLEVGPEKGFDCSGFVQHVFENSIGTHLPRHTIEMFCSVDSGYIGETALGEVSLDEMTEADLLFFSLGKPLRPIHLIIPAHVAVYSGNDEIVHSSRRTKGVAVTQLEEMLPRLLAVKRVMYTNENR